MTLRRFGRKILGKLGYTVFRSPYGIGGDAFADMRNLIGHDHPVVFDVGANVGQSVQAFRSWFQKAEIHSFEPSPSTFERLKQNVSGLAAVHPWNCALGSSKSQSTLLENSLPEWSSLLRLGEYGFGTVAKETSVQVETLDDFCRDHRIAKIDILKSDTQGYELEVFKGADRMFKENAVRFVYCEIIFSELYKKMASFTELYDFLISRGFVLVSFYPIAYTRDGLASWTDGLFVHRSCISSNGHSSPRT